MKPTSLSNNPHTFAGFCGLFDCGKSLVKSNRIIKTLAKVIEFYIPQSFRKVSRWLPPVERGKVLAFPLAVQKSA